MQEPWNDPAALARKYAAAVYRLAYARTGSPADAEDIMQETFLRLMRTRPVFDSEAHAKAWLLRVAANCASDLFRRLFRRREAPLEDHLPAPQPPETGRVTEAVLALPARYRVPIHLYYYEDLSVAEIEAITQTSQGTIKSRLFRARALLRKKLEEENHDTGPVQT